MDEQRRAVAWAIAEASWRKASRRAAGPGSEASSSREYADNFWQGFCDEAAAAIATIASRPTGSSGARRVASDRFA